MAKEKLIKLALCMQVCVPPPVCNFFSRKCNMAVTDMLVRLYQFFSHTQMVFFLFKTAVTALRVPSCFVLLCNLMLINKLL